MNSKIPISYSLIYNTPNKPIYLFTRSNSTQRSNIFTNEYNNTDNQSTTKYGIPFECIEFVRRFFVRTIGYTFPSIKDAEEMFETINMLTNIKNQHIIHLKTFNVPINFKNNNNNEILTLLKPGNILFWKKTNDPQLKYGHVAIILDSNEETTKIANQNMYPVFRIFNTQNLINKLSDPHSPFLGIKILPSHINNELSSVKIKHIIKNDS
jgi:hypothetical protein